MDAGPAQAAEDGVISGDLDRRYMRTGLPVAALGGHAGGGDLDEVLGHAAAREDRRRARPGRHVAAHDVERDVVVTEEVHARALASRRAISLGEWTIGRGGHEQGHVVAEARGS